MEQCIICGVMQELVRREIRPQDMCVEHVIMEGFILGVVTQRAVRVTGREAQSWACPDHLAYIRKAAEIGLKANPEMMPFMNFGLTLVK